MKMSTILIILLCAACNTQKPTTTLEGYPLNREKPSITEDTRVLGTTITIRDLSNNDTYQVSDPSGMFATRGTCARATIYFIPDTTVGGEIAELKESKCPDGSFKPIVEIRTDTTYKTTYVKRIE